MVRLALVLALVRGAAVVAAETLIDTDFGTATEPAKEPGNDRVTGVLPEAWHLEGTRFVERVALSETSNAYVFEGDGRSVAVLSPAPGHEPSDIPRPAGATVIDLFGNAVPADAKLDRHIVYVRTDRGAEELSRALGG